MSITHQKNAYLTLKLVYLVLKVCDINISSNLYFVTNVQYYF